MGIILYWMLILNEDNYRGTIYFIVMDSVFIAIDVYKNGQRTDQNTILIRDAITESAFNYLVMTNNLYLNPLLLICALESPVHKIYQFNFG